jgi:hypothetical protein
MRHTPAAYVCIAALFCVTASAGASYSDEALVPATFAPLMDAGGRRWPLGEDGSIAHGPDGLFASAAKLTVNNAAFESKRGQMTPDHTEFVLSGEAGTLAVARRIRLDPRGDALRYLDIFTNTGAGSVALNAGVVCTLRKPAVQTLSPKGTDLDARSFARDAWVVMRSAGDRATSAAFVFGGSPARMRPTIRAQHNTTLTASYSMSLGPQQTVAILHIVVLREGVDEKSYATLVEPFIDEGRPLGALVARTRRALVANFELPPIGIDTLRETFGHVMDLAKECGVERSDVDVLVVGDEGRFVGDLSASSIVLCRGGAEHALRLGEVAAFVGGASVGRPPCVYLRTGEAFVGEVICKDFLFTSKGGLEVPLDMQTLDCVFTRLSPRDGIPPAHATLYAVTREGERLALHPSGASNLAAITAWGRWELPSAEVSSLTYVRTPSPLYRVTLEDGSTFPAILSAADVPYVSSHLGEVHILPREFHHMTALPAAVRAFTTSSYVLARDVAWAERLHQSLGLRVSFDWTDVPLADALDQLEGLVGVNIVLSSGTTKAERMTPLTVSVSDVPASHLLHWLVRMVGLRYALVDEVVCVCTPQELTAFAAGTKENVRTEDELGLVRKYARRLAANTSLDGSPMSMKDALAYLGASADITVSLGSEDPACARTIDLAIKDVSLAATLAWVCERMHLACHLTGEGVTLGPRACARTPVATAGRSFAAAHFNLEGQNVLVGTFGETAIEIITVSGRVRIETSAIRAMARNETAEANDTWPFNVTLTDGSVVTGHIETPLISIRMNEHVVRVPWEHIIRYIDPQQSQADGDTNGGTA